MKKIWDFNLQAWRLNNGKYKVKILTTKTRRQFEKIGFNPIAAFIRILIELQAKNHEIKDKKQ